MDFSLTCRLSASLCTDQMTTASCPMTHPVPLFGGILCCADAARVNSWKEPILFYDSPLSCAQSRSVACAGLPTEVCMEIQDGEYLEMMD